ncbi:MAG: alkaline phosphatase family protein [bacterium]|nr:alkaline phosphatase family protein [bacterium]
MIYNWKRKRTVLNSRGFFIVLLIGMGMAALFVMPGCSGGEAKSNSPKVKQTKLVLMIVIDQLRADMISRMQHRYGKGGFRYLLDNGIWYQNAHYRHATTLTAASHATISTGGTPADHGILGNYWINRQTGAIIKSVENASPSQMTSTTIGDEMVLASGGKSRVFSVSMKDRGAILMGGFLAKSFWYNSKNGQFITSPYYYKKPPQWLDDWNKQKKADGYKKKKWGLLRDKSTYIYADQDDRPEEVVFTEGMTTSFPHLLDHPDGQFYWQLCNTPFADEFTLDFLMYLVNREKVGQGRATDFLTVSLSATDCVGHAYGPNSLEYEDNHLRLDGYLAGLFRFIDGVVGLENTLIVLSGDHGTDLIPEYRKKLNMPGGRLGEGEIVNKVNDVLQKKYKSREEFVFGFRNPSIYLNLPVIEKLKLDIVEVEAVAAGAVAGLDGVAVALTRSDLLKGVFPGTAAVEKLVASFHPVRSGNVLVLQEPFWFMYHVHDKDSTMHGSPYTYDTHVPILFSGPGVEREIVYRLVAPGDIAGTIALKLGIGLPSGSTGKPLLEVLQQSPTPVR